jgi:hypothetical protein
MEHKRTADIYTEVTIKERVPAIPERYDEPAGLPGGIGAYLHKSLFFSLLSTGSMDLPNA